MKKVVTSHMLLTSLKRLAKYSRNFIISAITDMLIYTIILFFTKPVFGSGIAIVIATVIARITSSFVNYNLNKALFLTVNSNHNRFFIRYYILWLSLLISTTGITYLINAVFSANEVLAKMISDMSLGIFSYQIQKHWVFSEKTTPTKRGLYFKFVRMFFRIFMKGKDRVDPKIFTQPNVLIGHHQNFYGPFLALTWLPDTVSFWVVDHLFNFKDCFRMYYKFTFVKTIKLPKLVALVLAFLCALLIPPLVRSSRSIPVYRDSRNIMTTFKQSLEILNKGEQVMIFPDVKYNDASSTMGEVHTGFTHIEKVYYQATNNHIAFVPIIIKKDKGLLTNVSSIYFNDESSFVLQKDTVINQIIESINSDVT